MKLEEAKRFLKEGVVYSVGNERTGMAESCREYEEAIDLVLQEIDNLQKENEVLSKTNADLSFLVYEFQQKIDDSISKDKIREKIEERKQWLSSQDVSYKDDYVLEVLQDLLKEEGVYE